MRVKGPTVTTGYHNDPEKTAAAFDEEGFYKLGDAARFLDPDDPAQGLVFDGRVTEDFKLDSGTWVSVGTLRPDLVAACSPYLARRGDRRPGQAVRRRRWPGRRRPRCQTPGRERAAGEAQADAASRRGSPSSTRTAGGSSRRIGRFAIMAEPPSIDAGEITDKGYVNQRATLENRKALVDALYANPPGEGVVVV
ncbi:MAG: AMP-binding protein [Pirellulales bacterium]